MRKTTEPAMMVIQTIKNEKPKVGPVAFSNYYIKSQSNRSDIYYENQYTGDIMPVMRSD